MKKAFGWDGHFDLLHSLDYSTLGSANGQQVLVHVFTYHNLM